MDIKLIGIDIDGTLLNSKKELTPATKAAMELADSHGVEVVISTGRLLSEYEDLLAQLPTMHYTVSCTGAQVVDLRTGKDLFRHALTADQMRQIYRTFRDLDVMLQIFSDHDGKIHNSIGHLEHVERYCGEALAPMTRRTHVAEADLDAFVESYEGPSNKVHMFFPDPENRQEAIRRAKDLPFALSSSMANDLELAPLGIDKGIGMEKLADHLGLQACQVMTLGDGDNDIGMLRYAGLGVAMANSSDGAKAAADHILAYSNDQDGVARAISAVIKGEQLP